MELSIPCQIRILIEIKAGDAGIYVHTELLDQIHLRYGCFINIIREMLSFAIISCFRIYGVFHILIKFRYVIHLRFRDKLRILQCNGLLPGRHEPASFPIIAVRALQLDQVTACDIFRVIGNLPPLPAAPIRIRHFLRRVILQFHIRSIYPLRRFSKIRNVNSVTFDPHFFCDQIISQILPVRIKIHRLAGHRKRNTRFVCQIVDDRISQHRSVHIVCQKTPAL